MSSLCMCANISATVALGCLFSPKVYLVLFQPYKNVRPGASICGGAGGAGNSSNNNHQQKFSQTSKFRNKGKQKSSMYLDSSGAGPPSSSGAPAPQISLDSLAPRQSPVLAEVKPVVASDEASSSTEGAPAPLSPIGPILNGNGYTEELSVITSTEG